MLIEGSEESIYVQSKHLNNLKNDLVYYEDELVKINHLNDLYNIRINLGESFDQYYKMYSFSEKNKSLDANNKNSYDDILNKVCLRYNFDKQTFGELNNIIFNSENAKKVVARKEIIMNKIDEIKESIKETELKIEKYKTIYQQEEEEKEHRLSIINDILDREFPLTSAEREFQEKFGSLIFHNPGVINPRQLRSQELAALSTIELETLNAKLYYKENEKINDYYSSSLNNHYANMEETAKQHESDQQDYYNQLKKEYEELNNYFSTKNRK